MSEIKTQRFDPDTIHLSKEELKRFLEIASGDSVASNTPNEDSLFRYKLICEYIRVEIDTSTNKVRADERAVKLSKLGEDYYAWIRNENQRARKESIRFWITTVLSFLAFLLALSQFLRAMPG